MDGFPGLYSLYSAETVDFSVEARLALFDEHTNPLKVFVFGAREYTINGVEVTPVKSQDSTQQYSHIAEYIDDDMLCHSISTPIVVYHIDGLVSEGVDENDTETPDAVAKLVSLATLHELSHWGATEDDQPDSRDHWDVWNSVLLGEIET